MTYLGIFIVCYAVAGALVLANFVQKNNAAAALLGKPDGEAGRKFHRMMWEKSAALLVRATFVFGSAAGAVVALIYWLASK